MPKAWLDKNICKGASEVPSYLADAAPRNIVIGGRHHENRMGIANARFHKFDVGDAAGEDLHILIIDHFGHQSVQFGYIAAVGIDLIVAGFEKVLYQGRTTIASGPEDGVSGHDV
jgi:hypothetical protein